MRKIKRNSRNYKAKKEVVKMATQIAVTPILYGNEALKVLEELKHIPSEKSKENGKKLMAMFNKMK